MARIEFGRHKRIGTQADDGVSDIQIQRDWNGDSHNQTGIFGCEPTTSALVSGAFLHSNLTHIIAAETGTTDDLTNITSTDSQAKDRLELLADTGDTITVKNSGNIITLDGKDKVLSETIPILLYFDGTNWYEYSSHTSEFLDSAFKIKDDADLTKQLVTELSEMTTGKTITVKSRVSENTTVYLF